MSQKDNSRKIYSDEELAGTGGDSLLLRTFLKGDPEMRERALIQIGEKAMENDPVKAAFCFATVLESGDNQNILPKDAQMKAAITVLQSPQFSEQSHPALLGIAINTLRFAAHSGRVAERILEEYGNNTPAPEAPSRLSTITDRIARVSPS